MAEDHDLSTVAYHRTVPSAPAYETFTLRVIEGPDVGATLTLDRGFVRALVGQGPACALRLTDKTVSRRHACVELTSGGVRVSDLGSKNGTLIKGLTVGEVTAQGGDVVHFGQTRVRIDQVGPALPVDVSDEIRFGKSIGASWQMRRLYPLLERLAKTSVPVVIEGETGTGKEVLAESLHECGDRASMPFVVFDCTAVPPALAESALFGHEKGAFTGAIAARRGVFEQAHRGTLFIDEIGDLELGLQAKLLRAIERSEIARIGSEKWIKVDVRVIAATRRNLDEAVAEGRFRDDLFFRLAVARVELPALRNRDGDVAVLAREFWEELGGQGDLPEDFLAGYAKYAWPGNVRELRNAVARRCALGDLAVGLTGGAAWVDVGADGSGPNPALQTGPQHAIAASPTEPDFFSQVLERDLPLARARQAVVDEFEKRYVQRVLARYGGSVARAAAASGIKRRYFQVLKSRLVKPAPSDDEA